MGEDSQNRVLKTPCMSSTSQFIENSVNCGNFTKKSDHLSSLEKNSGIQIKGRRWQLLGLSCKKGEVVTLQKPEPAISANMPSLNESRALCDFKFIHLTRLQWSAWQFVWSWFKNEDETSETSLRTYRNKPDITSHEATSMTVPKRQFRRRMQNWGHRLSSAGGWLNALPSRALFLLIDDEESRILVTIQVLWQSVCSCGITVDALRKHALDCKKIPNASKCPIVPRTKRPFPHSWEAHRWRFFLNFFY